MARAALVVALAVGLPAAALSATTPPQAAKSSRAISKKASRTQAASVKKAPAGKAAAKSTAARSGGARKNATRAKAPAAKRSTAKRTASKKAPAKKSAVAKTKPARPAAAKTAKAPAPKKSAAKKAVPKKVAKKKVAPKKVAAKPKKPGAKKASSAVAGAKKIRKSSPEARAVTRKKARRVVRYPMPPLDDTVPVLAVAEALLGRPYRFGGAAARGFDCSGFTRTVYSAVGVDLPHSARAQFSVGDGVAPADIRPGDLVFFRTYRRGPSHVGIYVGSGMFIHAAARGGEVRMDFLDDPYYERRFLGARRLPSVES